MGTGIAPRYKFYECMHVNSKFNPVYRVHVQTMSEYLPIGNIMRTE